MPLKLSVIIACYNMGDYVKEAISSVLSFPKQEDIEIIIVNDGSNDQNYTKKVLDGYAHNNLKVIHQVNRGLGHARNVGIKNSKAPYLLILDADNKIRHEYISKGIELLDNQPDLGIVYGDNQQFGLKDNHVVVGDFDISKILKRNYIDACVVMRKTAWSSVEGYDEDMPLMGYEDWDLNIRLFFKGWKFKYLELICFDYRVRENSMLVNSTKNVTQVIQYMFEKPEYKQAKILRNLILSNTRYEEKYDGLKNKKAVKIALIIERFIKKLTGFKFAK